MCSVSIRNLPLPPKPQAVAGTCEQQYAALVRQNRILYDFVARLSREVQSFRDQVNLTTADGDFANINITGAINHDGSTVGLYAATPVAQAAHEAHAATSHSMVGAGTVSVANLDAALDALGAKINVAFAREENIGIAATS